MTSVRGDGDSELWGSRMTGWTLFMTVFSRAAMLALPTDNNSADSHI